MACADISNLNVTFLRNIDFVAVQYQLCDEDGNPIDYTGYTIDADARKDVDSALVFTMGISWVDASTGTYQIAKTDTETAAMTIGDYIYDVVLTNGSSIRLPPVFTAKVFVRNVCTQS
jgi:hypothetical protein